MSKPILPDAPKNDAPKNDAPKNDAATIKANANLIAAAPEMHAEIGFATDSLSNLADLIRHSNHDCNDLNPLVVAERIDFIREELKNVARKARGEIS